jgi:hypothetical protein
LTGGGVIMLTLLIGAVVGLSLTIGHTVGLSRNKVELMKVRDLLHHERVEKAQEIDMASRNSHGELRKFRQRVLKSQKYVDMLRTLEAHQFAVEEIEKGLDSE